MPHASPDRIPTRISTAVFLLKASLLQLQRGAENRLHSVSRHPQIRESRFPHVLSESSTPLWTDSAPSEDWYQRGKIQNLRLAAARLNHCVVPAGAVFSFWRQVGRASAHKGYVRGRMLQEGCMIPAIGGGLCQLSNALYQVALDAGCQILERHPHSRIVHGSATAAGRDATVAWNYIDLRFRSTRQVQLRVKVSAAELHVSLRSETVAGGPETLGTRSRHTDAEANPGIFNALRILSDHACESCGEVACFRHDHRVQYSESTTGKAFLLDVAWPEFIRYVEGHRSAADRIATPLDGRRWRKPQYEWPTRGFASADFATLATLSRAYRSRRLVFQGAARQRALLEDACRLAAQLAKSLDETVDEVCVSQSLLPFLWVSGALGGRRITVLGYQLPAHMLEAELDRAFLAHPESPTLRDFRADGWLLEAEQEALQMAEQIITPHAWLGSLFGAKSRLLEWSVPAVNPAPEPEAQLERPTILFPCATLGRKGAYELREAVRGMDVRLELGGRLLESEHFWRGYPIAYTSRKTLTGVALVAQPSIVESQPRALLRALAEGIPVITTRSSGLHENCGAHFIPPLDAPALRVAIEEQLASTYRPRSNQQG